ncbi:MAG: NADPH:quinone oxidoreductase family protein [Myxococcota bacterium]
MQAWRVEATDRSDGIVLEDIAPPRPDAGLVVRVRAAGVGFPDLLMSRGEFQIRQPVPFTLGWEAAGEVVHAPAESALRPGDPVVTMSFGAFAEQVVANPASTFPLPAALSFHEGAALPLNYLTALAGLERRGRLRAGEILLVHGAGGGAGSAAVQVGKALGARVIAIVSETAKGDLARKAGADEVVLTSEPWRERVLELSGGGVHVVFDPVGGDRFAESLRCLASEGRLVVVGFAGGSIPSVAVNRLLLRNVEISGCTWSVLASAPGGLTVAGRRLAEMVRDGFVRPPLGALHPFADLPAALAALAERRSLGKLVLAIDPA